MLQSVAFAAGPAPGASVESQSVGNYEQLLPCKGLEGKLTTLRCIFSTCISEPFGTAVTDTQFISHSGVIAEARSI